MLFGFVRCMDWNCFLCCITGTGIGAYNARHLKECMDDTFHVSKKKGTAVAKQASEQAGPAFNKARENAAPYLAKAGDAAKHAYNQAAPAINNAKDKAAPYMKKASDAVSPHVEKIKSQVSDGVQKIKSGGSSK